MSLDHLLAANPLGAPLSAEQRANADRVLASFGFHAEGDSQVLDDTFPWARVTPHEGTLHVHVQTPLPRHLAPTIAAVLDGLVREAVLVRIDALSRRAIEPGEWARRLSALSLDTPPRGRL